METSCEIRPPGRADFPDPEHDETVAPGATARQITLGGGCFWCVEGVFAELAGVLDVTSGYAGGEQGTADYRAVCGGETGHAEVVKISYDPGRITLGQILKIFFAVAHDPTERNRQGNDRGTQYRSVIFFADAEQREIAESYIRQLDAAKVFDKPIATQVAPLEGFYEAEGYHQDYVEKNPRQPYVLGVAMPKIAKLREKFAEKLKN